MSATGSTYEERRGGDPAGERRVSSLELFFDLVFVFAIAQVTGLLTGDATWMGLLRGSALLAALWWAWVCYSWLTNAVRAEDATPARLVILSAMAAMLVASLAVPGAFGEDGLLFGAAYLAVRLLHVALYAIATGGEPYQQRAVLRLAPWLLAGPVLLVAAGFLGEEAGVARAALWAAALALDFGGPFVRGVEGLRVHASHFVERYGLVVIVALGESVVAIGLGAAGLELGPGVLLAALLGVAVAAGLWWAYFDHVSLAAERRLGRARGHERARLARDSYGYLHLPMVAGIVFVASGVKQTLAHAGDPLGAVPSVALLGGVALYLLGHNAFRLRDAGSVSVARLVAAGAALALVPLAARVPALLALGAAAALLVALAAFETSREGELRRKLRAR